MSDFKVGDCVKKVRGDHCVGHKGWVTNKKTCPARINGVGDIIQATLIKVSGAVSPVLIDGNPLDWWIASNWEKVVLTGEDKSVTRKAPKERMA